MNKYPFFVVFWVTVLACQLGISQKDETIFTMQDFRFTGAWGGPSFGGSTFDGNGVTQTNGFFVAEFNKTLLLGWSSTDLDLPSVDGANTDLKYRGLLLGYTPNASKAFHPQAMLLLGTGDAGFVNESKDDVWVIQPAGGIELNIFQWFRVGAVGGYRFVTDSDVASLPNKELSSLFGEITLKFGFSWGK